MTALSEAVHVLTEDHKVRTSKPGEPLRVAEEYSLLQQLDDAKHHGMHTGASGSGGAKLPFGAGPHDLEESIIRTIHRTVSVHHRYELACLPLPAKVQTWVRYVDDEEALEWIRYWSELIRDLYRTKFYISASCPMCGEEKYTEETDGETTIKDALMVTVETETAGCLCCQNIWVGVEEIKHLSSLV